MLFKREVVTKILEVEKGTKLPELTTDLRESLKTLQYHPAFVYLLHKLKVQKAVVQNYLNEGFQLEEKELRYLQAGVFWLNYIESELGRLTKVSATVPRSAADNEAEEFARVQENLDLVGVNQS